MKCDHCGHQFPPWEGIQDTRNEQVGPAWAGGAQTETVFFKLCPDCAADREASRRVIFWTVGLILAALIAVALVGSVFS
jgi:hypothetical protein